MTTMDKEKLLEHIDNEIKLTIDIIKDRINHIDKDEIQDYDFHFHLLLSVNYYKSDLTKDFEILDFENHAFDIGYLHALKDLKEYIKNKM